MSTNPPVLRASHVDVDGVRLHVVSGGQGAPVLFLHGFPEFWYAWRRQLPALAATHRVIAVDLPGCNLSERPTDPDGFRLERVGDLLAALIRILSPDRPVSLVGHDLGGTIAWDLAARHPRLVDRLVAIGAPPRAVFARELERSPAQRDASAYMQAFRTPWAESGLLANGAERLLAMLDTANPGAFGPAERDAYVQSWSRPGSIAGALGYYRAFVADPTPAPQVIAPTLVIWGDDDRVLLPGCLDGLDAHAKDVRVQRLAGATHWLVHEHPERITESLRRFLTPRVIAEPVFDIESEREVWRKHPEYGCFFSGPDNPVGLRVTPVTDRGRVWIRRTFERDHSGVIGLVHCGVVFTMLEGLMAWLVTTHLGRLGMTTKATIEYLSPVHVGREYEFEATPDPDAPNTSVLVHARARVFPVGRPDQPCAVIRGQFNLPTLERAERMLGRTIDVSERLFRGADR